MPTRTLTLLFAIVNAVLYATLLPLWEGFDEAFHYSYVETLWATKQLPVLGRTQVCGDVSKSFHLAPVSQAVHAQIPDTTTFKEWFLLTNVVKKGRRKWLEQLRPEFGGGSGINYEAQQAPLAYVVMAPIDRFISGAPITSRVLVLRLTAACLSALLIYWGASRLCRIMEVPEPFTNAAILTVFCSQMLYATTAHVGNDWLAVGLCGAFVSSLAELVKKPGLRFIRQAAFWLAAGLLTKAYFLAFVPLLLATAAGLVWLGRVPVKTGLAAVFVLCLALPWYARNLILFGNISGTQEEFHGVGWKAALTSAPKMNWLATAGQLARTSLWTGNNTFFTFSQLTLNIVLALLCCAVAAWLLRWNVARPAERIVFAAIAQFSLALAYESCSSFAMTHGESTAASPWYAQVLLVPVLAIAYVGMSRWKRLGPILAACTVVAWAWVLLATWIVKLFPMYSGITLTPMRFHEIWNWYANLAAAHAGDLTLLALAPAPVLYSLMAASVAMTIVLVVTVVRELLV